MIMGLLLRGVRLGQALEAVGDEHAALILRHGRLVYERYFAGDPDAFAAAIVSYACRSASSERSGSCRCRVQ